MSKSITESILIYKSSYVTQFILKTQSVYGISKYTNKTIKKMIKILRFITEYAKSKLRAEKESLKLADNKFCVVILKPSTVHGPSEFFRSDI